MMSETQETPLELDVQQAKSCLDSDTPPLLIDCRERFENELSRIEGSVLIPMNETPARVNELESHREQPIIVHCHHGQRSLNVVYWLRENGFPHAQSMTGGIDEWSRSIDPNVPRY